MCTSLQILVWSTVAYLKIDQSEYSEILAVLPIEPEFVANTYAKQILQAYESQEEFFSTIKVHNQAAVTQNEPQQKEKTR